MLDLRQGQDTLAIRIIGTTMNPRAFQNWIGRLALVALLLLVAVPTAGRLVHAAAGGHASHAAHHAGHAEHAAHADHANHRAVPPADGRAPGTPRPAPGDADCDYCPLLASLLAAVQVAFVPAGAPRTSATRTPPAPPRLPWLHPSGLGSRGPPLRG